MTNSRARPPYLIMLNAVQSVNNSSTFVNTKLTAPLEANSMYKVEIYLITTATAVADIKFKCTVPSAASSSRQADVQKVSASTDTTFEASQTLASDASEQVSLMTGYILTGSTAGNITLQIAQVTPEVSNSQIIEGSYLQVTKATKLTT